MTLLTFRPFLFLCFQCSITLFELQHTLREHRTILREWRFFFALNLALHLKTWYSAMVL